MYILEGLSMNKKKKKKKLEKNIYVLQIIAYLYSKSIIIKAFINYLIIIITIKI